MKKHWKIWLCLWGAMIALWLTTQNASANMQPTSTVWITFVSLDPTVINLADKLERVELYAPGKYLFNCPSPNCKKDIFGGPYDGPNNQVFICKGNQCQLGFQFFEYRCKPLLGGKESCGGISKIQIVLHYEGRTFVSQDISVETGGTYALRFVATIDGQNLNVRKDTMHFNIPALFYSNLVTNLCLELGVGGVLLIVWKKMKRKVQGNLFLASIILGNLISYPVAWIVIPSFASIQFEAQRIFGLKLGIFLMIIAVAAVFFAPKANEIYEKYISEGSSYIVRPVKIFQRLVVACLVLMALLEMAHFLGDAVLHVFVGTELNQTYIEGSVVAIPGFPPDLIIPLAETFAVGYEAILIYSMFRKSLMFRQALMISLLINAFSFSTPILFVNLIH